MREIKSYVLRSRMTSSQQDALNQFWPLFGVNLSSQPLDFVQLFQRQAPTVLEIGFGMGSSFIELAETHPDFNFIGIEVHKPGVGALLRIIQEKGLQNVRVICHDALPVMRNHLPRSSLSAVLVFFPDPWPKRRHYKRRIIQPNFITLVDHVLCPGGYLHLATDIPEYAAHMHSVVTDHANFAILDEQAQKSSTIKRPKTKFERRGEKLGHCICDLVFIKTERRFS